MNLSLLDSLAGTLFSGLCNSVWRTTLVACAAMLGTACLPERNRTLRRAFWLTALAAMAWVMATPALMGPATRFLMPESVVAFLQFDVFPLDSDPLYTATGNFFDRWVPWLVALSWTAGAVLMAGRFISSRAGLFLLRENAKPVNRAGILDMVRDLSAQVGVRRKTVVLSSRSVRGPVVVGITHPAVVLPEHIAEKYPLDMLAPILIHELAHIRQRDHLVNAFQHLIGIGLFFHPLYWLICRRLVTERERSCDDFVVRLTGSPRRYALCLAEMAEHVTGYKLSNRPHEPLTDTEQRVDALVSRKSVSPLPSTAALVTLMAGAFLVTMPVTVSRIVYEPRQLSAVAASESVSTGVGETPTPGIPVEHRTGNSASFRLGNVGRWQMDSETAPTYGAVKRVSRGERSGAKDAEQGPQSP